MTSEPRPGELLRVAGLVKQYSIRQSSIRQSPARRGATPRHRGEIRAVDGVDLTVGSGETLAVVGESGCGKSTLGRLITRLEDATAGHVYYRGADQVPLRGRRLLPLRREVAIMFQDPHSALSPRLTVHDIVAEPLRVQHRYRDGGAQRVREALGLVGLPGDHEHRYAHEFSGGQRQRIALARALVGDPALLVLDEPVSALDVSIRAQVVNQLRELQRTLGLSYVFISHDLSVVRHLAHRVAVMYLGRVVETGSREEVFTAPRHPYTVALLSAVPVPDPRLRGTRRRITLTGEPPDPADPPSGCRFRDRCWKATARCAEQDPPLLAHDGDGGHLAACHFPEKHRPEKTLPGERHHPEKTPP